MPPTSPALASPAYQRLLDSQAQVVSRSQLGLLGVGRQLMSRRTDAQLWRPVGPHVLVLHSGPLSRLQEYWVGVLHSGPAGVLGGLTALEAEGFRSFTSSDVVTLAPHGSGRRSLVVDGVTVRVRESRHLARGDVARRSPPRIRRDRATVDAASAASSERACRTILAAAVQQRLVRPAALRQLVLARPFLRRRALLLETIEDVAGGSHSLPELEYLRGLRRFGLPEPSRQRNVRRAGGRYYLDADFDEWQVTAEINGAQHLTMSAKEADDVRRTRLAIGGRLVVDLGSHTVRHDIVLAVLLTADALISRGWQPPLRSLRRLLALAAAHPDFTWTSSFPA